MKQFGTILKFELKNYAKNKAFVGVTIFLMVVIAIVMFFPRITALFESEEPSDPGEDLVRLCAENGVDVLSIPGCCAAVNALAVSGLPTGRFTFEGFLTINKKSRRERLDSLKNEERTMIFHEAPHKLLTTLEDLCAAFGADRPIALCRELTKLHEETRRCTLGEAVAHYAENTPKGEFVLVVGGAGPRQEVAVTMEDAVAQVLTLKAQGIRLKDAAKEVAEHTGFSKNELYAAALER